LTPALEKLPPNGQNRYLSDAINLPQLAQLRDWKKAAEREQHKGVRLFHATMQSSVVPEGSVGLLNSKVTEFFIQSWNARSVITQTSPSRKNKQRQSVLLLSKLSAQQSFTEIFDAVYYRRQITPEPIR